MQPRLQIGDRIRLIAMPHDPDPIPAGSLGTVVSIREYCDWTQVDVDWDSGRTLLLTMPDDCVAIVEPDDQHTPKPGE